MTPEEIKGTKFEIFLEKILRQTNLKNIHRNVEFHKSKYLYRQVDLIAWNIEQTKITKYAIEAKYSTNQIINYDFRRKIKRKTQHGEIILTNIIDQIQERQQFIQYDATILITNTDFEKKIIKEAKNKKIILLNGQDLQTIYIKLGYADNIQDVIKNTQINWNDKYKNKIMLR